MTILNNSKSLIIVCMSVFVMSLWIFGVAEAACDYPDDRDSAGNRCGNRAASVRMGGRLGGYLQSNRGSGHNSSSFAGSGTSGYSSSNYSSAHATSGAPLVTYSQPRSQSSESHGVSTSQYHLPEESSEEKNRNWEKYRQRKIVELACLTELDSVLGVSHFGRYRNVMEMAPARLSTYSKDIRATIVEWFNTYIEIPDHPVVICRYENSIAKILLIDREKISVLSGHGGL